MLEIYNQKYIKNTFLSFICNYILPDFQIPFLASFTHVVDKLNCNQLLFFNSVQQPLHNMEYLNAHEKHFECKQNQMTDVDVKSTRFDFINLRSYFYQHL